MRTFLLILGTLLSLLVLSGCPIFVDTTPLVKTKVNEKPFEIIKDSVYCYDPNYFDNLDRTRPYQVPSGLTVTGYKEQWVIAPEFAGASALDQLISRITVFGWYCVTDSTGRYIRRRVMFPGDVFQLSDPYSFLAGKDRVYPGDSPWSVSQRIMETDSLQESWKEKQLLKKINLLKDSSNVINLKILIKEGEVEKEQQERKHKFLTILLCSLGLLSLFLIIYFRKELAKLGKKVT